MRLTALYYFHNYIAQVLFRKTRMTLDILMLKGKVGIIMELKNEKNSEEGLFQILEND